MDKAIALQNVCLSVPGLSSEKPISILKDISLDVQSGETVSVVGASGSGKTSLLMVIAGVEKASSGVVEVLETDISHYDEDQLADFRKGKVGVVFQNFHLIPTMTALENVSTALEFARIPSPEREAKFWLDKVGLSHRLDHHPEELSGGEQQRVALARAFSTKPAILLADEPTGNLDSQNGQLIVDMLFDLQKENGTTLMLITHDLELSKQTSRCLRMHDGGVMDA